MARVKKIRTWRGKNNIGLIIKIEHNYEKNIDKKQMKIKMRMKIYQKIFWRIKMLCLPGIVNTRKCLLLF
jgi:hypothetical protein